MASNLFDYIDIQGESEEVKQAHVNEVSFAIRGQFPKLPSKQYNAKQIRYQVRKEIAAALTQIPQILPQLVVVHAQLAMKTYPRAVNFEDIHGQVIKIADPLSFGHQSYQTSRSQAWSRLAVYLAMAYHSLYFVRTNRSPLALVPLRSMDAINKVMYGLTRVELDLGCNQLVNGNHQTGLACALQDFLNHYALWNDQRLARAAEAVLERCQGNARMLDTPRALSNALNRLSQINLFPWVLPKVGTEDQVLKRDPPSAKTFTPNFLHECVALGGSIALSVDSEHHLLHIYIPRFPKIPSVLGRTSKIGARARSVKLRNTVVPLMDQATIDQHAFAMGKKCPALRLSINYHPKTFKWDVNSANVDATEVVITSTNLSKEASDVLAAVDPSISEYELQLPKTEQAEQLVEKNSAQPDERDNVSRSKVLPPELAVVHAQAAAGRIAGVYMKRKFMEAPYLVSNHGMECISDTPGWHERLNTDAYVPVSRPFDSSLALLAQRQLLFQPISPLLYSGQRRTPLAVKLQQTILPQLQLIAEFEFRDLQYWTLRNLQLQLQSAQTFHIFRCILLEPSSKTRDGSSSQGQLIRAFCLDLGIHADVFVPPHTEQVFDGDQVIGTEILELDPLQGLLVVSI